jgi:hypothetical protein
MWSDPKVLLNGYDDSFIEKANNDYRTRVSGSGVIHFFVTKGLIGFLGAIAYYFFYAYTAKNRKFAFFAFLFFLICFVQRCYFNWYAWILCYCWAIEKADLDNINKRYLYE